MFEKISRLCADHGITISRLETELGLGNGTIGKWRTSTPTLQNIKRVADYFGVPIDSLIDNSESVATN